MRIYSRQNCTAWPKVYVDFFGVECYVVGIRHDGCGKVWGCGKRYAHMQLATIFSPCYNPHEFWVCGSLWRGCIDFCVFDYSDNASF